MTLSAMTLSRPDVGSSRKMSEGQSSSSVAMIRRFLSPPAGQEEDKEEEEVEGKVPVAVQN